MTRRKLTTPLALLTAALIAIVPTACSSNSNNENPAGPGGAVNPLVGTWNATSMLGNGMEVLVGGLTFSITFRDDGTFSTSVANDPGDVFCDAPETSCNDGGDYTSTSTTFTLDAGSADEETLNYTIAGDVLTASGDLDGTPAVLTFSRG
jgi:hypothetical protein